MKPQGTALLHGVTSCGKTEIYIDLIRRAMEGGSQVLYLLPEIALTTQIVFRLKKIFGASMGVYHSKFSDNERVEVWNGVLNGKFRFVIGVRSSIFLPFDNLGLIIVDEEHDPSYKQQDPSPRYHARDVALMMAQQHHAKVLLGTGHAFRRKLLPREKRKDRTHFSDRKIRRYETSGNRFCRSVERAQAKNDQRKFFILSFKENQGSNFP